MAVPTGQPQQFTYGSAHLFLGIGGGAAHTAVYFGTTESRPDIQIDPRWSQLMNDASGAEVPLDMSFQGALISVGAVMTRIDPGAQAMLESYPDPAGAVGQRNPGIWNFSDIGTLAAAENVAFPLYVVFMMPTSGKAAYSRLVPGYYIPQCIHKGPVRIESGSKPGKISYSFFGWPKPNFLAQTMTLFSNDAGNFVGLTIR